MDMVKSCVLMQEPSIKSLQSLALTNDPYGIGILLAAPITSTTLPLLSTLLEISKSERIPEIIKLSALVKLFRHFSELHHFLGIKENVNEICPLLSAACKLRFAQHHTSENSELLTSLSKLFEKTLERLCVELRTSIEIVKLVISLNEIELKRYPSDVFRLSPHLCDRILQFRSLEYKDLLSVCSHIWEIIKEKKSKDFDPIKNVGFILILELIDKGSKESLEELEGWLLSYSNRFTKSQKLKIIYVYEDLCRKKELMCNASFIEDFDETENKPPVNVSAWDIVEDDMKAEEKQQENAYFQPVSVAGATVDAINIIKAEMSMRYVSHDFIKLKLTEAAGNSLQNLKEVHQKIIELIENDSLNSLKVWKLIISVVKKFQLFNEEQIRIMSSRIRNLENGKFIKRQEEPKIEKKEWRVKAEPQVVEKMEIDKDIRCEYVADLARKMQRDVEDAIPDAQEYDKIRVIFEDLKNKIAEQFQTCELVVVGSLKYKLYLKGTAVDLQANDFSYGNTREYFQPILMRFLELDGECTLGLNYLIFKKDLTFHIYINSRLPQCTSDLIFRYIELTSVTDFVYYVKLWGRSLLSDQGNKYSYFWTVLSLFFLCNSEKPALKNLVRGEMHQENILEGYDVWTSSGNPSIIDVPIGEFFVKFVTFIHTNFGCCFNSRKGEIVGDEAFDLAVTDFFTDTHFGIPKNTVNFRETIKKAFEELNSLKP